jgi:hypothetical protein
MVEIIGANVWIPCIRKMTCIYVSFDKTVTIYIFFLLYEMSAFFDVIDKSVGDTWNHLFTRCGHNCRSERW